MNISLVLLIIIGFLLLNIISHYKKKLILPEAVWVLVFGAIYGCIYQTTSWGLPDIVLSSEIILYWFVPILIFANARNMSFKRFKKVMIPASLLASVGLILSATIIAAILYFTFQISFLEGLLFGSLISATDPLAVTAMLRKSKGISRWKRMLVEWESILNDGIAVTMFTVLTAIIIAGSNIQFVQLTKDVFWSIAGAAFIGFVLARIIRMILKHWDETNPYLKVNMWIVIAYGWFLLADSLHASGIIAVFVGALTYAYHPRKDTKINLEIRTSIWEYLEFLADATLFFILWANFAIHAAHTLTPAIIACAIVLLLFARWASLTLLRRFIKIDGEVLKKQDISFLNFAGSRGAISIALILMLPLDYIHREFFLSLAYVMVILSILIYPFIVSKLLSHNKKAS